MTESSYPRWQAQAILQKQTASALVLALSAGMLAFLFAQISPGTKYVGAAQSILFHIATVLELVSIVCGVGFSFNRISDFDVTAAIARIRQAEPKAPRLASMREKSRTLGRATRRLFMIQAVTFVLGAIAFVSFVALRHSSALYARSVEVYC
jgi:hypothetical protein